MAQNSEANEPPVKQTAAGKPAAEQPPPSTPAEQPPPKGGGGSPGGPSSNAAPKLGSTLQKVLLAILGAVFGVVGAWMWDTYRVSDEIDHLRIENDQLKSSNDGLRSVNDQQATTIKDLRVSKKTLNTKLDKACQAIRKAVDARQLVPVSQQMADECGLPAQPPFAFIKPEKPGVKVPMTTSAEGTVDMDYLDGRDLWFAVTTPGTAGFFVQGDWRARTGPAEVSDYGHAVSPRLTVGQPTKNIGGEFAIVAIRANNRASGEFWEYLRNGVRTGDFPAISLPDGAEEITRIDVVRK